MGFTLEASCAGKIAYAEESLLDKISYFFTSDKSISEKIGDMLYQMGKMEEEDQKALESTHLDYKMQTFQNVQKMMGFSGQAVDFVVANTRKYEGKSYALLENEREEMQQEIDSEYSSFSSSHNREEIIKLVKNEGVIANKTYAQLGFTHNNLFTVAKEFKDNQSGRLTRMKKMKFISQVLATRPQNFQMKVVHEASFRFAQLLDTAISSYKYVDKFLYLTYKELQRQKIIT